jgi:Acetyltransferase (GNAT) domain
VTLWIVREGRLDGYGVLRKCRSGRKIGPLFADDPALAESLFLALKSAAAPEESVFLDVPEINRAAVTLAERHDLKVVFETARMYKGAAPDMPMERIFGIASFEVG